MITRTIRFPRGGTMGGAALLAAHLCRKT